MKSQLGGRIKQLRKNAGMTQSELASELGISASAVGMYEQGRREPDNNTLRKLCSVFGVSVDYLIGDPETSDTKGNVEVAEVFDEFTKRLTQQEGLMFDGVPLDREDRIKIIEAIKVVAALARQQHKAALDKG